MQRLMNRALCCRTTSFRAQRRCWRRRRSLCQSWSHRPAPTSKVLTIVRFNFLPFSACYALINIFTLLKLSCPACWCSTGKGPLIENCFSHNTASPAVSVMSVVCAGMNGGYYGGGSGAQAAHSTTAVHEPPAIPPPQQPQPPPAQPPISLVRATHSTLAPEPRSLLTIILELLLDSNLKLNFLVQPINTSDPANHQLTKQESSDVH